MKYLLLFAILLYAANSSAAIQTKTVEYKDGKTVLEGYIAWDDSIGGQRPGIMVVHEWTGINPYIKNRVEQLAKLGYVAFAADIYGKGVRPSTPEEASKTATMYKTNRQLLRERANKGLSFLKEFKMTDPKKVAAIGYCFGGTTVLELARSGADLSGAVSFHGGLDSPSPADGKNIKAKVLVLHGADDPYNASNQVAAFQDEMRKANVDWRMVYYGGAVHSFTNPGAGNDNSKGAAYNERADKRSWQEMLEFFGEIF
jgi:dienelactone hydrolase